jgi:pyrroloquinoline quinone (PQQ) biosynthesis protein C
LLFNTPLEQVGMRIELVKTLHSELGNGRLDQAHITLLDRFAQALGLTPNDLAITTPLPEVQRYMQLLHRLFIDSDYLTALGAETAVEVTAASEFKYFYPGLRKYSCFQDDDLIFFKLHLQEEQCHGQWLLEAVEKTAHSPEDRAKVLAAARETADAWHAFWRGLYKEVFGQ